MSKPVFKTGDNLKLADHLIREIRKLARPSNDYHLRFVNSVQSFIAANGRVSEKQLEVLKSIYEEVTNP